MTESKNIPAFFALVIIFSIPFWILGGLTGILLLPGLPIDAFMVVCPVSAALVLVYRENGKQGMTALLKRGIDVKNVNPKGWYFPAILLMPTVSVLVFFWLRWEGIEVPDFEIKVSQVLLYVVMFLAGALCEELGWSGYLTDPMQNRLGALNTGIVIGLFWAVYHLIALMQVGRPTYWIIWWSICTVALRVIILWLYNNAGRSVFIAVLLHMMFNLAWQLFPINGSYYSPDKTGVLLLIIAVYIVIYSDPRTLIRKRKIKKHSHTDDVKSRL